ncbi:MAG: response regulator [Desulfobacteraceae bacterium]|jgi:two-component system response regulator RstA
MTNQTQPLNLLLIEDDLKLSELIKHFLESNHFTVSCEVRGEHASDRILNEKPDLVILDILLPGKDGRAICREVRPYYDGPIIMLTALAEEVDQIVGLELGADDYITKPVRPRLLLSRINAILRLTARVGCEPAPNAPTPTTISASSVASKIVIGDIEIDAANRSVRVAGQSEEFSTSQFDLLFYLANHAGRVITRNQLYKDLRGIDYDGFNRSIDLQIARLREKIGDNGKNPRIIKSIWGEGYMMVKTP